MVRSPKEAAFFVDVKGLHKKNFWPVRERPVRKDLFYVLAFVPTGKPSRFFVLTQERVNTGIRENFEHAQSRAKAKGLNLDKNPFPGIEWKYAETFDNAWNFLPK